MATTSHTPANPKRRWVFAATVAAALAVAVTACSSSSTPAASGPSSPGTATTASPGTGAVELQPIIDKTYAGDFGVVPATGPKAVTGKKVWFISCGQLFVGCATMATNFKQAGDALGWQVTVQDSKADPSLATALLRQAIAAHIDGVGVTGFDCPGIRSALLEAQAAKLPVLNFAASDCSDPAFGGGEKGLFTASVKLRGSDRTIDFFNAVSRARAQYVVAKAGQKAVILSLAEQSHAEQKALGKAFDDEIAKICATCQVVPVKFTFAQVPSPATQIWQTAIQTHANATVITTSLDSLMPVGLQTAILQGGRTNLLVGGGEGNPANFDLIRSGKETFSVAVAYSWIMWGLADSMNRVFAGEDPKSLPDEGAGWQYVDATHNLPASGAYYEPSVDFRTAYKKVWSGQ